MLFGFGCCCGGYCKPLLEQSFSDDFTDGTIDSGWTETGWSESSGLITRGSGDSVLCYRTVSFDPTENTDFESEVDVFYTTLNGDVGLYYGGTRPYPYIAYLSPGGSPPGVYTLNGRQSSLTIASGDTLKIEWSVSSLNLPTTGSGNVTLAWEAFINGVSVDSGSRLYSLANVADSKAFFCQMQFGLRADGTSKDFDNFSLTIT